jgi:DNA-binding NarL/FixJ family response regulator
MDMLLGARDLPGAERLLTAYEVPQEAVPPAARFMLLHLRGHWDEALSLGRRVLANGQAFSRAPNTHTLFAWMAECLLARGYVTGAGRMLASAPRPPEGPLTVFLDAAQAQVLRTLDRDEEAEQVLRGSLAAADARGHVYATAELLAVLADLHADAGRTDRAARCVERLRGLAARTSGDRARLLHLLASARLLRAEQPAEARGRLREAVELARARRQPFETAVTLAAAAAGEAGPPGLLHEAYELFGSTGSLLARFHTRSALREAGLSVPGRRQATAESEQLLAVLVADGLSNREIATVLRISEDAVANRLSRLFARTGLRSRTELASAVLRMGPALIPA